MTLRPLTAALALLPVAAMAQSPMGAEAFEDYVTGKTLTFSSGGVVYGVEEYLPDRRVRWSFVEGECKYGRWYQSGEEICFVYEDGSGPQCWTFRQGAEGLRARFTGDPPGSDLYETRQTEEPLTCPGPEVGV